jgi:hypothetical protein
MKIDRHQARGRRGSDRMRRQVILLTILLVAVLVILMYFRAWLDDLAGQGGATAPTSVGSVRDPQPLPPR